MQAIIITDKEIEEAFFKAEKYIEFTHEFMYGKEIYSEFKKTKRYEMVQMFRLLLDETKNNIKAP